ncbi:MAG: oxidoreductase [Natrialbaceae archaeon]|nr:oxidoreductase [Natrialbaceae archaeon]
MSWNTDDIPDQSGRRVVITGANSGIGLEAARELARAGATVVMGCRSLERGEAAADDIRGSVATADIRLEELDLASLESVSSFAETVGSESIDVLINNAGVMAIPRRETEDGFEQQFGVNHLGHFALTGQLLDAIEEGGRIVTVSSGMHTRGSIDFDDPMGQTSYDPWGAYAQSKLANVLFAYELDRRLRSADRDIASVAVHPGYAATNLQYRGPEMMGSTIRYLVSKVGNLVLAQSAAGGALPTLYAATDSAVEGESYYGPGGLFNMRGVPERQRSAPASYDEAVAEQLWTLSEDLTGVEFTLSPRQAPSP